MVSQVFYHNQSMQYPSVQRDLRQVKAHVSKVDATDRTILCALDSIPQFRRFGSFEDKMVNGDNFGALGLMSLAVINFEEDLKDVKSAAKQVKAKIDGRTFDSAYNYKNYQHPFSFFRGTMIERVANPEKSSNKEFAKQLLDADKTFAQTNLGNKFLRLLGVKDVDYVETRIKDIGHTRASSRHVWARNFKGGGYLAEITGRAMNRVPVLGAVALALFELPKIFKAAQNGDTMTEQAISATKQTVKSGLSFGTVLAAIAYGGAIGSKHFGPAGSLLGMGAGAVLGSNLSRKTQEIL